MTSGQYSVNEMIRLNTSMFRSDSCNYSDAYIAVKGKIDLLGDDGNKNDKSGKNIAFKNNALFR